MKDYKKHNNLYNQIRKLAPKIPLYYKLEHHQKQEAINNTLINLLKKEAEGKLILDDYEHYKGYLFITLKNAISRFLQVRNTQRYKNEHIFIEDNFTESFTEIETKDNKLNLNHLTPLWKSLFRWYMRKWTYRYISKVTGIPESTVFTTLKRIKTDLSKQV